MLNAKTAIIGISVLFCALMLGLVLILLGGGMDERENTDSEQLSGESAAVSEDRAGSIYTGTVTDVDGNAIEGAKLHILGPCTPSTVSGREGKYRIRWNPSNIIASREVWLIARHEERNLAAAVKAKPEPQNITLLPAITATGTITDIGGGPIPNGSVSFGLTAPKGYISSFAEHKRFAANSRGVYEVRFIPQKYSYSVGIYAEGYKSKKITVNAKDAVDGVLALRPFAMVALSRADEIVSGVVVGSDGKAVSKVQVFRKGEIQPAGYEETDTNGKFTLNVCEGEVILNAVFRRDDGRVLTGWATVPSGTDNVRIVLKPYDDRR